MHCRFVDTPLKVWKAKSCMVLVCSIFIFLLSVIVSAWNFLSFSFFKIVWNSFALFLVVFVFSQEKSKCTKAKYINAVGTSRSVDITITLLYHIIVKFFRSSYADDLFFPALLQIAKDNADPNTGSFPHTLIADYKIFRVIYVIDDEFMKLVQVSRNISRGCDENSPFARSVGPKNTLMASDLHNDYYRYRKNTNSMLSQNFGKKLFAIMWKSCNARASHLKEKLQLGAMKTNDFDMGQNNLQRVEIDLMELCIPFVISIQIESLFDVKVPEDLLNRFSQHLFKNFDEHGKMNYTQEVQYIPDIIEGLESVVELVDYIFQHGTNSGPAFKMLIDLLKEGVFSEREVKDHIRLYMFAQAPLQDVFWTLYFIFREPNLYTQMIKPLRAKLESLGSGNENITEEGTQRSYCHFPDDYHDRIMNKEFLDIDQLIKESQRLRPGVPMQMTRKAENNFVITSKDRSSLNIRKNDILLCTPLIAFRNPKNFDKNVNSEAFNFSNSSNSEFKKPPIFSSGPFGSGKHACAGKKVAQMIMKLSVLVILNHFNFHNASVSEGEDLKKTNCIITKNLDTSFRTAYGTPNGSVAVYVSSNDNIDDGAHTSYP